MGRGWIAMIVLSEDFRQLSDQYKRSVKKYRSSTMLSAETPKHNPSKPPQMARKSVRVYCSSRFNIVIK